jgi:hypothetical protein
MTISRSEPLTFEKTLVGDTVLMLGCEMIVVRKFDAEKRPVMKTAGIIEYLDQTKFEYDSARPMLVRGKGKP